MPRLPNLSEFLDGIFAEDLEAVEAFDENIEFAIQSVGFQWASVGTQKKRDRTRSEFEKYYSAYVRMKEGRECIPEDAWRCENLDLRIREYLNLAATVVKPKSHEAKLAKYNHLVERRQGLWYWIRTLNPEYPRHGLYNKMVEAIKFAARRVGLLNRPSVKPFFGINELRLLLDSNHQATHCPQNALQHSIAWILAFATAARPGSLCKSAFRSGYLKWADMTIYRDVDQIAGFQVSITFEWWKGWNDEERKPMTFMIRAPRSVDNAELSLPHRIIALLLKRNYLEDYNLDEANVISRLLRSNEYQVKIKESALEHAVFLKSTPRGLHLVDEPMSAHGLSEYLHKCARQVGLICPKGGMQVSFYAWRRSAANRIQEATDVQTTRTVMHHDPSSTVFESHYSNLTNRIDLFAIAANEEPGLNDDTTSAALMRVEANMINREDFIKKFIGQDATVVRLMTSEEDSIKVENDLRLAKRSARRMAIRALEVLEKSLMEKSLTTDEILRRRRVLQEPSNLMRRVKEIGHQLQFESQDRESESLPELRFVDPDSPPEHIIDLDSELDLIDSDLEMAIIFESLMSVLLEGNERPLDPEICKLCVDDETIEVPFRDTPFKLQRHLKSNVHTKKEYWKRSRRYLEDESENGSLACPWGCDGFFKSLIWHGQRTTSQSDSHLLAVGADGLFDDDWEHGRPEFHSMEEPKPK